MPTARVRGEMESEARRLCARWLRQRQARDLFIGHALPGAGSLAFRTASPAQPTKPALREAFLGTTGRLMGTSPETGLRASRSVLRDRRRYAYWISSMRDPLTGSQRHKRSGGALSRKNFGWRHACPNACRSCPPRVGPPSWRAMIARSLFRSPRRLNQTPPAILVAV